MLTLKFENNRRVYTDLMGNRYQYDLNNPNDKLAYEIDLFAQMRDKMSLNPTRDKNGGGIYEDN